LTDDWRQDIRNRFGPEIVVKCCRLHKGHYNGGRWGACRRRPEMTDMTWEQADAQRAGEETV
jgi:hypothetical protein